MKSLKWKFALGIFIACIFLFLFFRTANLGAILAKSRGANLFYLFTAFFFVFLSYAIRSWRWQVMLRPMGIVSFWSAFKITCIGFMFNNLIPRTGEIARPVLIGKKEGISISSALATVFIERVLDFLTLFSFFAIFSVISTASIVHNPKWINAGWFLGIITVFLILFMTMLKWKPGKCLWVSERVFKFLPERFRQKLQDLLKLFISGLDILGNKSSIVLIIFLSFLMWFTIVALTESVFLAFGSQLYIQPPLIHTYFLVATLGVVFCAIAMMVPTPGGVGSFHVALALALTLLGENKELSDSIAVITHAITWFPITISGLIFLYTEGMNFSGLSKTVEEAEKQSSV